MNGFSSISGRCNESGFFIQIEKSLPLDKGGLKLKPERLTTIGFKEDSGAKLWWLWKLFIISPVIFTLLLMVFLPSYLRNMVFLDQMLLLTLYTLWTGVGISMVANEGCSKDRSESEKWQRNHALEHKIICLLSLKKPVTMENLKMAPRINTRCGSNWVFMLITLLVGFPTFFEKPPHSFMCYFVLMLAFSLLFQQMLYTREPTENDYVLGLELISNRNEKSSENSDAL